jgi:prepilin-type N-terminal cleavage/methylation domain-containing protein
MRARPESQVHEGGFTLIEALVVLAVVGFTAAIGYPELDRALTGFQARKARGELVAGVFEARSAALGQGRPVALAVDPAGTAFSVGEIMHTLSGHARIDGRPQPLWFFPDGSANGGELTLVTAAGNTTFVISRDLGDITVADAPAVGAKRKAPDSAAFSPANGEGPGGHA